MNADEACERARSLFLRPDNLYGCAETTFLTLKEAYRLTDAPAASVAMVFNGGIAYQGMLCGAISGAAMAVGLLAEQRCRDHAQAKRCARQTIAALMDAFKQSFSAQTCRELTGYDFRNEAQHQRFVDSGIWRTNCMAQIEFVVARLVDGAAIERAWAESAGDYSTTSGAA